MNEREILARIAALLRAADLDVNEAEHVIEVRDPEGLLDALAACVQSDDYERGYRDGGNNTLADWWVVCDDLLGTRLTFQEAAERLAEIAALCEHPDHDLLVSAVDVRKILEGHHDRPEA